MALLVVAAPAFADRHCMPALDKYFAARYALQSDEGTLRTRLDAAIEDLAAAQEYAAVCGCPALGDTVGDLLEAVEADAADAQAGADRILGFAERMEERVQACH